MSELAKDSVPPTSIPQRNGIALGIFLGVVNAGVVALGLAVTEGRGWYELAMVIFVIALLPGVVTGALLGWIADVLAGSRVWIRLAWVIVPALAVVAWLGVVFDLRGYIVVSSIPTVAGCLLLERGTRLRPSPLVPVAQVRR